MEHIHGILQQRDEVIQDTEWVLEEAMSVKKLNSGGTFRNVLSRKLDEVITPILTHILEFVDRYSNLDLVCKGSPLDIRQFWISVFKRHELCQFSYEKMVVQKAGKGLAAMGQRKYVPDRFPFFCLFKEVVDSHWDNVDVTGIL